MDLIGRFPYSHYPDRPAHSSKSPIIEVTLENALSPGRPFKYPCVLDTGADCCLLPASLCEILGHNLSNGIGTTRLVGLGGERAGHLHTNKVSLQKRDAMSRVMEGAMEIFECQFFMCENWDTGIGLLGHRGFFSVYSVFFNTKEEYFAINK